MALGGRELILGVTGSIAAYKAVYLLRELTRAGRRGHRGHAPPHAEHFVGRPHLPHAVRPAGALRSLRSRRARRRSSTSPSPSAPQAVVVAPATANLLAKAAHGIADDFLTTLLLAARVPGADGARHGRRHVGSRGGDRQRGHAARARASRCSSPTRARSPPGSRGRGRLPEVDAIVEALERLLTPARDLAGERVLVTVGADARAHRSRALHLEPLVGQDGPRASPTAALRRGAEVILISGPTALTPPAGAVYVPVQTAEEMREAALQHLERATIVIKAAAVADYRVEQPSATKIKSQQGRGAHARSRRPIPTS